jgi:hypothetical protein
MKKFIVVIFSVFMGVGSVQAGENFFDESNINEVANHFYRPGKVKPKIYCSFSYLSPQESYKFLSGVSKYYIKNKDTWEKIENNSYETPKSKGKVPTFKIETESVKVIDKEFPKILL